MELRHVGAGNFRHSQTPQCGQDEASEVAAIFLCRTRFQSHRDMLLVEAVSQIVDRGGIAFCRMIGCGIFAVLDGGDDGDRLGARLITGQRRAGTEAHGHGSLILHLGLVFDHHDAGEDARAAAEVVLRAEGRQPAKPENPVQPSNAEIEDDFDLTEDDNDIVIAAEPPVIAPIAPRPRSSQNSARAIGTTEITQGNINNDRIYRKRCGRPVVSA